MKRASLIISFIVALTAGTFYAWLNEPKTIYSFEVHLYFTLSILSFSVAFLTTLILKIKPEESILLSIAGIIAAVIINSAVFGISLLHTLNDEIFIILFFAGHASLMGTYGAVLARKIYFKTPSRGIQPSHKAYPRYSVVE